MIRKNKYTSNVFLHRFGSRTSNQHCNNHGLDRSAQLRESCRWQHLLYWCWSELRDGCDARFVYLSFRHTLVISKRSWKKLSFFKPLTFIHISQLTLECVYCAQTAPSSSTPGTGIEGIQQMMASQSLTDTHIRHGGQVRSWFWLYWYYAGHSASCSNKLGRKCCIQTNHGLLQWNKPAPGVSEMLKSNILLHHLTL